MFAAGGATWFLCWLLFAQNKRGGSGSLFWYFQLEGLCLAEIVGTNSLRRNNLSAKYSAWFLLAPRDLTFGLIDTLEMHFLFLRNFCCAPSVSSITSLGWCDASGQKMFMADRHHRIRRYSSLDLLGFRPLCSAKPFGSGRVSWARQVVEDVGSEQELCKALCEGSDQKFSSSRVLWKSWLSNTKPNWKSIFWTPSKSHGNHQYLFTDTTRLRIRESS